MSDEKSPEASAASSVLQAEITAATKTAMKARDKERVAVLRMINAEFKRVEVDERRTLSDTDVLSILGKMQKQRQDAHSQFVDAKRDDLAAQEAYEMEIIAAFLPAQLSAADAADLVAKCIADVGASSMADMGKVMAALKQAAGGQLDMGQASALVKQQLS